MKLDSGADLNMAQINVTIAGRTYRMACDDGQEDHLQGLAAQVNVHIENLREGFGDVGDMRLLIMAALVLADELHEARRQASAALEDVRQLSDAKAAISETVSSAQSATANALDGISDRIEAMIAVLGGSDAPEDSASS